MTNEDALYWCERFTDNVVISNLKGERMFLALEAMKQCKEAIGKQIHKKAKISLHGTTDWNTRCRCPVCDKDLFDGQKYCSECGQKIDWGKGKVKT